MEHVEAIKIEPEAVQENQETLSLNDGTSAKEVQFAFIKCEQEDQEQLCGDVKEELLVEDCQFVEHLPDNVLADHHWKDESTSTSLCSLCGDTFTSSADLLGSSGCCSSCSAATAEKVCQEKKRKSPLVSCHVCHKVFSCFSHLSRHVVSHTNDRPYVCRICNKGYKLRSHLVEHMSAHSEERLFFCTLCCKSFKLRAVLKRHMRIHDNNNRPLSCELCHKSFRRLALLQSHICTSPNVQSHHC